MSRFMVDKTGLPFRRWIVREVGERYRAMDAAWDALDELQPIEDYERTLAEYNGHADFLDALEAVPGHIWRGHEVYKGVGPDGLECWKCRTCENALDDPRRKRRRRYSS